MGVFTRAVQHWLRWLRVCLVINTFWLLNTVLPGTLKCLTVTVHQNQRNSNHELWENTYSFKELLDLYVPSPPRLKQGYWYHGQLSNPFCVTCLNHGSANFPKPLQLDRYVPSPPHLKQVYWYHGQLSNPFCYLCKPRIRKFSKTTTSETGILIWWRAE